MKKSQVFTLIFLLRLIVAIVLVLFIFAIARKCVGNTSEARVSFEKLVNKINTIQEGELLSMPLVMDKDTMIIFFNKGRDNVSLQDMKNWNIWDGYPISQTIFGSTADCSVESACICLHFKLPENIKEKDHLYRQIKGTKFYCKKTNNDLFYNEGFYGYKIALSYGKLGTIGKAPYKFEGGLFLQRSNSPYSKLHKATLGVYDDSKLQVRPRIKTTYIEKYHGVVGVCEWHPCLTEENKKEIDALLSPIIKQPPTSEDEPEYADYDYTIPDPVDIDI